MKDSVVDGCPIRASSLICSGGGSAGGATALQLFNFSMPIISALKK